MQEQDNPSASTVQARTGQTVTAVIPGPVLEIRSDFDQRGRTTLADEEGGVPYQEARARRRQRPGSILLPNLNEPDTPPLRDNPEERYLTRAQIRPSEEQRPQQGDRLMLRCQHSADTSRVVGYGQRGNVWNRVLGGDQGSRVMEVSDGWTEQNLRMYAWTLPGDPRWPGPVGRPPPEEVQDTYTDIKPGEIWIRLRYRQSGATQWKDDDVALFRIAPFVLQSNLEPARRLYVVSAPKTHNFVYDVMEACWNAFGVPRSFKRPSSMFFSKASTPQRRRTGQGYTVDHSDSTPSSRDNRISPDKMYLIDGNTYPDLWIQDQMVTGYCSAPGDRSFNVAVNCKRRENLRKFVNTEIEDSDDLTFVFNGLSESQRARDTTDHGGNIAVAPPVKRQTDARSVGPAGPHVPEHPPAPQGKIVLGDCYNEKRQGPWKDRQDGTVHQETRDFLRSQGVQPIIPVDTSWLKTGRVNEIMTFVPTPNSRRSAKLAMASPAIMDKLLKATRNTFMSEGRTHFHRGRHRQHHDHIQSILEGQVYKTLRQSPTNEDKLAESYDETTIDDFYQGDVGRRSREMQQQFLTPIKERLCHCTGLDRPQDVLHLPVYFDYTNSDIGTRQQNLAEARTPNLVNMQVLNMDEQETHLLLPRPCGPRLPPTAAESAVQEVLNKTDQGGIRVRRSQETKNGKPGFSFWAWPYLKAQTLALFFTREKPPLGSEKFLLHSERAKLINCIKKNRHYETLQDETLQQAVEATRQAICTANPEVGHLLNHPTSGRFNKQWNRIFIPEDTVDVLELYTRSVLRDVGCTVHFVDAWHHHAAGGGVCRATNVLHEPPSSESRHWIANKRWWRNETDPVPDDDYDPTDTAHVAWHDAQEPNE